MIGSNLPFGEQTSACGSVYCWLGLFDNGLCRGGSDGGRGPGGTRCAESVGADAAPSCYGRRFRRWCRRCGRRSRRSRPNIGVAETAVGCGQPSRRTRPDRTAMPINVKTFTSKKKKNEICDGPISGRRHRFLRRWRCSGGQDGNERILSGRRDDALHFTCFFFFIIQKGVHIIKC